MKRYITIFLLLISMVVPVFAAEAFYQSIINASYLGDFAYGTFPLSLWADFGVSGISLIDGVSTKIYARIEAGLTQRALKQYPQSGDVIPADSSLNRSYLVAFSDGSAVWEQGLVADEERPGEDKISISIALRMRWEQAFPTFKDMRDNDFSGIFDEPDLFPDAFYVGTPELNGDRYFLSNSFSFTATYNKFDSHYLTPNGYKIDASIIFAPFWLANELPIFNEIKTDAYRINVNGNYDYTILDKKTYSGKNLYSMYVTTSASATFLFGKSIPRYMQDKSFMGKSIVPRLFYSDIYAKLQFNGPEFLSLGTYPAAYVFIQNGVNAGPLINNKNSSVGAEFFGGFGVGVQMTLIGYLRAFVEYSYIYTPIYGEETGGDFNIGCYFTMAF